MGLDNAVAEPERERLQSRIRGMLLGSLIGDALGGPVEFQSLNDVAKLSMPPKQWQNGERLNEEALKAAESRLMLRPYAPLRPDPEPYGHWLADAPAGTITDDSRHKFVLMHALRQALKDDEFPVTRQSLARAFLEWPHSSVVRDREDYRQLCEEWLEEFAKPARWILGERDRNLALPPERMWIGLPTCCGQMILPPIAAVYPGQPENAYLATWNLAFFDNGFGKDLNAALVAGLAVAMMQPDSKDTKDPWSKVVASMRETDPYHYGRVPWTTRPVDLWLDKTFAAVDRADHQPARLFAEWEQQFSSTIKWQAEVPFVVALGALRMCPRYPLAALQLSIEWGHDTDSYAALVGAFIGARFGEAVFPKELREPVEKRLRADFEEELDEWVKVLAMARRRAGKGGR